MLEAVKDLCVCVCVCVWVFAGPFKLLKSICCHTQSLTSNREIIIVDDVAAQTKGTTFSASMQLDDGWAMGKDE